MTVSLADFVQSAINDNRQWSHDIPYLTRYYSMVPVFVYNQYKIGMKEHHVLKGSDFVGLGKTLANDFQVYLTPEHEPVAFVNHDPSRPTCQIQGEVYQVPVQQLFKLDRLMCNLLQFKRGLQKILFRSKVNDPPSTAECWTYCGLSDQLKPFFRTFRYVHPTPLADGPTYSYTALSNVSFKSRLPDDPIPF